MGNCAGVDWAGDKHDVRVCDEAGEELLAATFVHDESGLRALCRALLRLKVQLVAIERPDGLLVERMLDAGLRVLPMHPNQVAAARARFRAAGKLQMEAIGQDHSLDLKEPMKARFLKNSGGTYMQAHEIKVFADAVADNQRQ